MNHILLVILESRRVSLKAIRSINLFDIEYLISSIFLGRLTMLRKAILKPLSLGMELRLVKNRYSNCLQNYDYLIVHYLIHILQVYCPFSVPMSMSLVKKLPVITCWFLYITSSSYSNRFQICAENAP